MSKSVTVNDLTTGVSFKFIYTSPIIETDGALFTGTTSI